jgi:predicted nucleotidyltransferase
MPAEDESDKVSELERELGANWSAIRDARGRALVLRQRLHDAAAALVPEDTSVVVFGSLARNELTSGSDIDWTLLVDGLANPRHYEDSMAIDDRVRELGHRGPGREGTFGGLAFSHDLIHRIGGNDDTNRNTTQRILLLLESAAIGPADAYERTIRNVLKRYVIEDYGWLHRSGPFNVPRFLQNDIARYWRTVAVDFAYKRRQRRGDGWAIRTVKLRLSRKMTFVAGLLACFSCATDPSLQIDEDAHGAASTHPVIEHLSAYLRKTPLEILAATVLGHEPLRPAGAELFGSYNDFLALLDDPAQREHLQGLPPQDASSDAVYQDARGISHRFQGAVDRIFLEENGTEFPRLTRAYGVF